MTNTTKFCKDCKYYSTESDDKVENREISICSHPILETKGLCLEERRSHGHCGIEGKNFTPRETERHERKEQ